MELLASCVSLSRSDVLYTECIAEYILVSVRPASRHFDDLPLHRFLASDEILADKAEACLDVSRLELNEVKMVTHLLLLSHSVYLPTARLSNQYIPNSPTTSQ